MTAFEFLSRAYRLDQQVQSKTQQISDLRAMASHVSAFMGNEPVSHTRDVTSMQTTVAKIIDEEARLNQEIDQLVDAKQEISEVIAQVQDVNLRKYTNAVSHGYSKMILEEKNMVEVLGGLERDDQLVVRGFETLRDGSKVKIQR